MILKEMACNTREDLDKKMCVWVNIHLGQIMLSV